MYSREEQLIIREDVFRWLDNKLGRGAYELTRDELTEYHFGDTPIPLLDRGRGIRNPRDFDATLTIMTGIKGVYKDVTSPDGFVHYAYQSREGGDNVKLKRALEQRAPLVYFEGVRPGVFVAHYPAYVVADDAVNRTFLIALEESMRFFGDPLHMTGDERRYAQRAVRQRLHQPAFRARIMHAYASTCAVCHLKHAELLDAAHIVEDSDIAGLAVVTNGMALCKIHHAAYDRNLMGITPDYEVRINGALLDEVDGPMLRYGLQDMHGKLLVLPGRVKDQPSRDGLAFRWEKFVA
jgi:putative restriction endonuclease